MKQKTKVIEPSPALIDAAKLLFIAMAHTQTVRPVVVGHQRKVLQENKYPYAAKYADLHQQGSYVNDPIQTYLMSDADFADYCAKVYALNEAAGLHVEDPETCPLLIAENLERQARDSMIKESEMLCPGFDVSLCYNNMENLDKYTDLTLRYVARYIPQSGNSYKDENQRNICSGSC